MRNEKKPLFKKEAKEEALHFGVTENNDEDEDIPNMVTFLSYSNFIQ